MQRSVAPQAWMWGSKLHLVMLREIEQGLEIAWNLWDRPKEDYVTRMSAVYVCNKGSLYHPYPPPFIMLVIILIPSALEFL
jgi:hypothetical protein